MNRVIYLDHHATTPVDERVLARMLPTFTEDFGNAASRQHAFGWKAEELVETARGHVAALLGASAREIIFTSGATEANNLALLGAARLESNRKRHIVTQASEHKSVLDPLTALAKSGFEVTVLPVDAGGRVDPELLRANLRPETLLCSVMFANNEVGTLQPLAEIGAMCHEAGVWLHADAAQGLSTTQLDVERQHLDLVSISAHKMYGPKGVGALYVRRRAPRVLLEPLLYGGGHERGWRSGTLNVPGIVGLGEAARLAMQLRDEEARRVSTLRDRLWARLTAGLDGVRQNGDMQHRLAGNLHVTFDGIEGETLLLSLRGLAVSSGAACTSASLEPSHVLRAMGMRDDASHRSVRFGIGRLTTETDIEQAASLCIDAVRSLRQRR